MPEFPAACRGFDDDLSALLDEELAPGREAEVRAHLEACAGCRSRFERLCQVDLALASLPVSEVPAGLADRLRARVAEERHAPPRGRPVVRWAPRSRRRWRAAPWIGAALGAALVLYLSLPRGTGEVPAPAESAPAVARTPAPTPEQVETPAPAPAPGALAGAEIEALPEEELDDLAVALELETVEDLDVIANLDLLEAVLAREGAG